MGIKDLFGTIKEKGGEIVDEKASYIVVDPSQYAFLDQGSNILAVAHLDTVQQDLSWACGSISGKRAIVCSKLDNRLGAYTILHQLPKMGVNVDILLTEDEEVCQSTASFFTTEKKYNWIVSFDRAGTDFVSYSYYWDIPIKWFGKEGIGSYSDIADLQDLGCKGINVGNGTHSPHSETAYVIEQEYFSQLKKFIEMYNKIKDAHFPHEKIEYSRYKKGSWGGEISKHAKGSWWNDDDWWRKRGLSYNHGYDYDDDWADDLETSSYEKNAEGVWVKTSVKKRGEKRSKGRVVKALKSGG